MPGYQLGAAAGQAPQQQSSTSRARMQIDDDEGLSYGLCASIILSFLFLYYCCSDLDYYDCCIIVITIILILVIIFINIMIIAILFFIFNNPTNASSCHFFNYCNPILTADGDTQSHTATDDLMESGSRSSALLKPLPLPTAPLVMVPRELPAPIVIEEEAAKHNNFSLVCFRFRISSKI
jgi:hypothetical protein